ncbi:DUF349 domain-containing protein [Candidatus Parabeggiatoa sp. HSG14]|uniref:DUF349 domain-containing protein n=1 Tax=Candidatus Parabeggiatoa sp. HSG14 TaxID=3055593 RepID=UPI0025A75261|nr:DUF349 domain-containing protein [Thiotrichales bacterium HSG14]
MIFNKFSKPKWQHRKPEVRKSEIEKIDDSAILSEVAQKDENAEVRRAAIRKINELNVLNQVAEHDEDNGVREFAEQRLKQMLCCQKDNCPDLNSRLAWLSKTTDMELLAYVAQNGLETELRLAIIPKIEREGLLGDIAINDSSKEVRLAAVEKLTQKSTLERVFKAVRNSNKQISRQVREKLDKVIEQIERPARVRAEGDLVCTKLESLGHRLNAETSSLQPASILESLEALKQQEAELKQLQERWQAIAKESDMQYQTRFNQLHQSVKTAFTNYQQAIDVIQTREQALMPLRKTKKALCDQTEALLIGLKNREHIGGEDDKALNQRLNALQSEWTEIQVLDDSKEEQQWQSRFQRFVQSIQKRHKKLQEYHQLASQLQALCNRADTLLSGKEVIKPDYLKSLQVRWKEVSQPEEKQVTFFSELNSRFDNVLNKLQTRLKEQQEQGTKAAQELKQVLTDLEIALECGELKTALPLEQQARQLLKIVMNLPTTRYKLLENRLQNCSAKISELRSWQHWGNKLEREKLCQQLEDLLATEGNNPSDIIHSTEEAQTAWKRLGASGYSRELWERFNKACQQIYYHYRGYLCFQMENLREHAKDNPEEIARQIRQTQATWKNLGSQGHSQELWERFNQACQDSYEPCRTYFNIKASEREHNFLEKQRLCDSLEVLVNKTDWENLKHIEFKEIYRSVREIENTWRNIGATDRKVKKNVQRRFQAAMQVLETNLDQERQHNCHYRVKLIAQVDELANHLQQVLADKNEANIENNSKAKKEIEEQISEAIRKVKKLQNQWEVTVPGNRRIEREFWKTFRSACDVVFNYRKQQQDAHKKEIQGYLESKIALCEQAEKLLTLEGDAIKTTPVQVKKYREQWRKINVEWNKVNKSRQRKVKATEAVEDRFEKACKQVERQYQVQLTVERREQLDKFKQKAAFCAELEKAETIIKGKENTDWLSTTKTAWAKLPKLEDANLDAMIEQRFLKACNAVLKGKQDASEKVLKDKETLCIRMEILAGIDSPSDSAKARLAYQVSRLSAAMRDGEKQTLEPQAEAEQIEQSWYLSDAVPSEQTQRLEQRFSRACDAFYSQQQRN